MVTQWNGTLFLGLYCLHVVLLRPVVATNDTSVGNKEASSIGESCTASNVCEASERSTISSGPECGVWLALSTIPGAGLGIFAGKKFRRDEALMVGGDQTIPIVDIVSHQGETIPFLWDDYTWNAEPLGMEDLGWNDVNVASPGIGAVSNSLLDFVNTKETVPTYSIPHGLHRRSDPGVGAFTYYHGRLARASSKIIAGEEIFVSYGSHWFVQRKKKLGPIPLKGDHSRADELYRRFRQLFTTTNEPLEERTTQKRDKKHRRRPAIDETINETDHENTRQQSKEEARDEISPSISPLRLNEIGQDLWDSFVLDSAWRKSPIIAALPPKQAYDEMHELTLKKVTKRRLHHNIEWLEENGVCVDTMYAGLSSIHQAGHGAFASRRLDRGSISLLVPLIHVPNRQVLDMYVMKAGPTERDYQRDTNQPMPPQLLLNYCMGHRDSTLLLCPFGPLFSLINHNQTLANVRLQWASPTRSQHNPSLLNMTVLDLHDVTSTELAMELVALRDIEPGEEIFLDYGEEWEMAWQKHLREWRPVEGAESYVSSLEMNEKFDHVFRTESEQMENPYPSNLMIGFLISFEDTVIRQWWLEKNPIPRKKDTTQSSESIECKIMRREQKGSRTLYAILIPGEDEKAEWELLENVPQEAIVFQDRPYTIDMFLPNAFRHDLRIPDELFPKAWKNLNAMTDSLS